MTGRFPSPAALPFHVALAASAAGLALAEARPAVAIALALAVGAALARMREAQLGAAAAALLLGGSVLGDLRLAALDAPAARVRDGARVSLRAHLLTPPRPGPFGSTADVAVAGGRLRGSRLLVRIPRWVPLPATATPGDELRLRGRTVAQKPAPGGTASRRAASGRSPPFDFAAHLRRRGIAGELLLDHARVTGRRRGGSAGVLDGMRSRAERGVAAGMTAEDAALLLGMVLGQDERVTNAVREDFRASGLAHLLAVSGQNVMLLAALAMPLLMLAGAGLRTRLIVLTTLVCVYVPLAGAGPSLQRAGLMGVAGIAAMAASRPASRSYALLLAATGTLLWNPRAWADPGWQLSFAAVTGILVLGLPLRRALRRTLGELLPRAPEPARRLAHGLADGIAITVAASIATAPLLAHHFGSVPLASLPANLLALPAVAPAMWLGMLKIALGQAADVGPADDVTAALGAAASVPVSFIALLAERFADAPGGQIALGLQSPLAVLAAYAGIGAATVGVRRLTRPLEPRLLERAAWWRRLPRGRRSAVAALVAAGLSLAGASAVGAPAPPGSFTVRFLDVGQGDATLIQHPDGTAVLFDGGPPEAGTARLLRRAGVRRVSLVVATHASRDHHGGLPEVLRRFPVDALLDGGDGTRDPAFRALLREAAARGIGRIRATAPLELVLANGDMRIRILSPAPRQPGPPPEDPNPRAVVAIVSSGDFQMLLSADAESGTLLPLDLPDVDAMKIPHHGSSDPGLTQVLDRLAPELAAIEVGHNTYGHPNPTTLGALRRAHVPTYRTDRDGTVTLTADRSGMRVQPER
jgi:competence protein ComEC